MGTRETYQRTLMQACVIVGDEAALARQLHVPVSKVVDWIVGEERLPNDIFLRAVDIVVAANKLQVAVNRDLLEQIKRRHGRSGPSEGDKEKKSVPDPD